MNFDISLLNWGVFFVLNGLILMSSHCVASRWLPHTSFAGTVAAGMLIYLMQAMLSVLLLGVIFHYLNALSLGVFNALLSSTLIVLLWSAKKPLLAGFKQGLLALFAEKDPWFYLFAALLVGQIVLNLTKAAILPVHIWDSFTYHAPPAVMWFQMGMIPLELDVPVSRINGNALGLTVLMYWYFIFLKDSLLVNLPQFIMSFTMLFLVYAMGRQCGVSRGWSFKAAVLCYFLPVVLLHSVTTQDHLSVNIAFIAALFFIREFFRHKHRGALLVLSVAVALMMQYKINAVVYFPVLAGFFLFAYWQSRSACMRGVPVLSGFIKPAVLVVALSFSLGGYWYAKNVYIYGDVFGPVFSAERGMYAPTESIKEASSLGERIAQPEARSSSEAATSFLKSNNLLRGLEQFFPNVLDSGNALYGGDLTSISGFGPQFFALGLPALLVLFLSVFIKSLRRAPRLFIAAGVMMLLLYFSIMANKFAYRNFSFFPILVMLYFVALASVFKLEKQKLAHTLLSLIMLVCIMWSAWSVLPPTFSNPYLFKEFVSMERQYQTPTRYSRLGRSRPNALRQLTELPTTEPIIYINSQQEDAWIYPYYDVKWQRKLTYMPMMADYLQCNEQGRCKPSETLKTLLKKKEVSLVSTCLSTACLSINDSQFFEISPGLYYFLPEAL